MNMEITCYSCKSPDVVSQPSGKFICSKCNQEFYIFESDPSTINEMQNCALKFKLTSIDQLERIGDKGEGFQRGDIVHAGFLAYYHLATLKVNWDVRVKKALAFASLKAAETSLEPEDIENVFKTIKEYFVHYKNDSWVPLEVEKHFKKLVYEDADLKFILSGKIDLKVDTGPRNNHLILPVDHKSGIDVAPNELSNQFMAYSRAEHSNLFCVNKIGFQKGRKDEPAPPEKKFKRHIIPYTNELLDHWLRNTVWWIKFAIYSMENETYPQNFTSCDKYSGCQFKPVCYSNPNNMEYKLQTMFRKRDKPWDPGTADLPLEELNEVLEKL
jgi:hypothetical protein